MKNLFVLLFLVSFINLQGQNSKHDKSETRWNMLKYDMGNVFKGMGYAYSRPLHWKGDQWGDFGITVVATGSAYLLDDPVTQYARSIKQDVPKIIRVYGFEYGSPANNYMITGAVYTTGLILKDEKLRRTGVLLIASASTAGLLQQIVKSAVGRARPLAGLSNDTFKPLWSGGKDYHSFPSGHSILAMTNAHAIAKQFKNIWVKSGIYTLGAIPAISRLWEGKHWLSDVVLSVAISIFTVESIDRYLDSKYDEKYNDSAKKLSWNLNFGLGQVGLVVEF